MLNKYLEELKKIELLSLEEEKNLWQKIEAGDEEARNKLVLSYQPLVFKTAMSFKLREDYALEIIQEGMIGLMEALERFDYRRGVAFSLFAIHRIKGRMLDYLNSTADNSLHLDQSISETENFIDLLICPQAGPEEIAEENLISSKVQQVMQKLPSKEQAVLKGIYLDGLSADTLAKAIEVSQTHVYRLQKQGVKRIRGMLSKFMHELKW